MSAALGAAFAAGRYVRALNLHATPASGAAALGARLAALAAHFAPVGEDELLGAFAAGSWPGPRPGLVVALYNGHRSNAEVAAPLLEAAGLTGWFFLPTGYLDAPAERDTMTWEQARGLADRGHVIASHTRSHGALEALGPVALDGELGGSRAELEARLGRPVRSVATYGGLGVRELAELDDAFARAEYELVFANHAIQRLPVPASSPAPGAV